jgi:acetyl esterase/lipase
MNGRSIKTLALSLLIAISASPSLHARQTDVAVTMTDAAADTLPEARIRLGEVTVTPDIVYSTLPGYRPLLLDLYRPDDGKTARPLVIFLHGGSWTSGSKREAAHFADFPGVLAMLAQRGFAVASVDYRLSGEARFPAALQDIKAAIRFLRANASRYGIDPNRVAVLGASAGAHLGAMSAFTGEDMEFDPPGMANADQSDRVQAFVGWYGLYDLGSMFRQSTTPAQGESAAPVEAPSPLRFFGCTADGCPPGVIANASPVNFVDKNDPPTLLIHGSDDTSVPPKHSVELDKKLKVAGVSAKLVIIDGISHDWLGKDRESTAKASRQVIAETFDWLEQTLLKK